MQAITAFTLLAALALAWARPEQYTDRFDNVDIPEILDNQRLRVPYIKCLLGEGKCSPEGRELKSHVKEALENHCGKCTPKQQEGTRQVIGYLINNEPEYWRQLTTKYDPQRKYVTRYEDELRHVSRG